jgi:hypothetical protein
MRARVATLLILFAIAAVFAKPLFADHGEDHEATAAARKSIEYAMPYPGLLPDSPFYGLKMMRDRVVEFLISDPLKQAEFDLLQVEKRVGAGIYLIHKDTKRTNEALSTMAKGQQYFRKAFKDAKSAKQQGYPIKTFVAKMYLSSQKQREILGNITEKIPTSEKGYYQRIMKEADSLVKEAAGLDAKEHAKK